MVINSINKDLRDEFSLMLYPNNPMENIERSLIIIASENGDIHDVEIIVYPYFSVRQGLYIAIEYNDVLVKWHFKGVLRISRMLEVLSERLIFTYSYLLEEEEIAMLFAGISERIYRDLMMMDQPIIILPSEDEDTYASLKLNQVGKEETLYPELRDYDLLVGTFMQVLERMANK